MTVTVTDHNGTRTFRNVTKITECGPLVYLNYAAFKNDVLIRAEISLTITE